MDKNIKKAIEAESQYLDDKSNGENKNLSIYDYIAPFGYTSLEEYRMDRLLYMFKEACVEEVNITPDRIEQEGSSLISYYFNQHKPYFLWNTHLYHDVVFLPLSSDRNFNDFDILKPGYNCEAEHGNIMTFDGDLNIVLILPKKFSEIIKYIKNSIVNYLKKLSDKEITINGNDILIDGCKVSGSASFEDDEYIAIMYHISFADKNEIVRETFPDSVKVPGHIDFTTPINLLTHILTCLQLR